MFTSWIVFVNNLMLHERMQILTEVHAGKPSQISCFLKWMILLPGAPNHLLFEAQPTKNKAFPNRERSFGFHLLRGGKNHFSHIIRDPVGENASRIKSSFIVWRFIQFGRDLFLAIIIHACHDVWWKSWTLPSPRDLVCSRHQDCYILSRGSLCYFSSFSLQLLLGVGGIPTYCRFSNALKFSTI